jgi:phosphatidate cytidylyltransferase
MGKRRNFFWLTSGHFIFRDYYEGWLLTRVISGVLAIPIVLGIVLYGSEWLFFALIAGVVLTGIHEFFSMTDRVGVEGYPVVAALLSLLLLLSFKQEGRYLLEWGVISFLALFIAWGIKDKNIKVAVDQIAYTLLGILYVAGLSGYFILIQGLEDGKHWIVFLFLITWLGDSAAYYGGRKFGHWLLAPEISPGKTIEGALFGLAGSFAGGIIAKLTFLSGVSVVHCLLAAVICGIIGQLGDLAESILKRYTGVKDSGKLMPGHGGVLDRIDSLLFAGPAFYLYYRLVF